MDPNQSHGEHKQLMKKKSIAVNGKANVEIKIGKQIFFIGKYLSHENRRMVHWGMTFCIIMIVHLRI